MKSFNSNHNIPHLGLFSPSTTTIKGLVVYKGAFPLPYLVGRDIVVAIHDAERQDEFFFLPALRADVAHVLAHIGEAQTWNVDHRVRTRRVHHAVTHSLNANCRVENTSLPIGH